MVYLHQNLIYPSFYHVLLYKIYQPWKQNEMDTNYLSIIYGVETGHHDKDMSYNKQNSKNYLDASR